MTIDPRALARFVAGQELAARESLRSLRGARSNPAAQLEEALALRALRPALFAAPRDAVRLREDAAAGESWRRLRERWRR